MYCVRKVTNDLYWVCLLYTSTTASAEDRRQLTAAVAAGCREPTWKNQAKLAKEIPL